MGYHRAGWEVVGIDHANQPNYPFRFLKADAREAAVYINRSWMEDFQAIHASPPCQRYSVGTKQHKTMENHPDYIAEIRAYLIKSGLPYIIENVPGAPLINPITLCGSIFGQTRLRRHRLFESNVLLMAPRCRHEIQHDCISVTGHAGGSSTRDGAQRFGSTAQWKEIMGIDWMTGKELAEAIPPCYTEYIGKQLMTHIKGGLNG
jgi:DNA (cytosine-5)-methyltransferase 1